MRSFAPHTFFTRHLIVIRLSSSNKEHMKLNQARQSANLAFRRVIDDSPDSSHNPLRKRPAHAAGAADLWKENGMAAKQPVVPARVIGTRMAAAGKGNDTDSTSEPVRKKDMRWQLPVILMPAV